jgi:cytochrome c2
MHRALTSAMTRSGFSAAILAAIMATAAAPAAAVLPADDFKQNCASCHTVGGGRLVGPDLRNVSARRERAWLEKFVLDPQAVISSGDLYAVKLLEEARGVVMPQVAGMTAARAQALLDYIDVESGKEPSASAGAPMTLRPEDAERGRRLFLGFEKLSAGGPPCVTCHAVARLPLPGGGTLGPDLTGVFSRLGAERGLAAWLTAPASPTMQPVYLDKALAPDEITSLVAFFRDTAMGGGAQDASPALAFLIAGCIGGGAGLVLLDFIWRNRFTSVRAPLVRGDV